MDLIHLRNPHKIEANPQHDNAADPFDVVGTTGPMSEAA